ncbi:MAG: 4'-phosphopantetheinyl transferase superfamily protein [Bacteroidales bacterium]|nr:4'-phosphopantetheinyl transferase superfamily protein [Bacteroidales bacterium]
MNDLSLVFGSTRIVASAVDGGDAPRRTRERSTALRLASSLLGREVDIDHDDDGAPVVRGDAVHISVTHSARIVAVAVDPLHRIGIDIEDVRARQLRLVAPRVLSHDELTLWGGSDVSLTRAWTLKEALYKAAVVPGADWRADLCLPHALDGRKARACGLEYDVIYAGELDGALLTVVRRCGSAAL